MTEKAKQTRTPRNLESIKAGALKLSLEDRDNLRNTLIVSIDNEVKALQEKAANAAKFTNGAVAKNVGDIIK